MEPYFLWEDLLGKRGVLGQSNFCYIPLSREH